MVHIFLQLHDMMHSFLNASKESNYFHNYSKHDKWNDKTDECYLKYGYDIHDQDNDDDDDYGDNHDIWSVLISKTH